MFSEHEMEQIMDEFGTYLTKISYMYVKNWSTAEEIVQDTFLTYFKKPKQFKGQSSLKTYLTKICIHKSIDAMRSFKAKATTLMKYFHQTSEQFVSPIDEQLISKLSNTDLMKEVLNLPIKYREVIIYYYFEEMTSSVIADLLSIPESTVKTRLKRAKHRLKQTIAIESLEVYFSE